MTVRKVLVTGSSGTIGTRLCEKLLEDNFSVTGLDVNPNKWVKGVNDVTVIGNARDKSAFESLDRDFDVVVHLAANARVYNLVVDPEKALDNIITLFNALEFCRRRKVKRFIFASSREVYGNSEKLKYSEGEVDVRNCESPYTASKIGGEALVYSYQKCYGIDFIIVRFSNVYGMYDESDRVVPLFIKLVKEGKDLVVYGKGKFLDFTYIDDAIEGVMKCIRLFDSAKNDVYNLGSGVGFSIEDIAKIVNRKMGGKSKIIMGENRTGEVEKFVADTTKTKKVLDHNSETDIERGIQKSIEWFEDVNKEN